eukprot:gene12731-17072_t
MQYAHKSNVRNNLQHTTHATNNNSQQRAQFKSNFKCLYTKQMLKKRKSWTDGYLKITTNNNFATCLLCDAHDASGKVLQSKALNKLELSHIQNKVEFTLEFEDYLVNIEYETDLQENLNSAYNNSNHQNNTSRIQTTSFKIPSKFVPPSKYVPSSVQNINDFHDNSNPYINNSSATANISNGNRIYKQLQTDSEFGGRRYKISNQELDGIWDEDESSDEHCNTIPPKVLEMKHNVNSIGSSKYTDTYDHSYPSISRNQRLNNYYYQNDNLEFKNSNNNNNNNNATNDFYDHRLVPKLKHNNDNNNNKNVSDTPNMRDRTLNNDISNNHIFENNCQLENNILSDYPNRDNYFRHPITAASHDQGNIANISSEGKSIWDD